MRREDYWNQLEALYARLDAALTAYPGNPCGTCKACCTAAGLSQHVVSDLELDYLVQRTGTDRIEDFRGYAARERDPEGAYRFPVCPFYHHGCTVYPHRPFACRSFGHFRAAGTRLPEDCVFEGKEREFEVPDYLAAVPEAREMHRLKRDYMTFRQAGAVSSRQAPPPSLAHLDLKDPVDRAWKHLFAHEFAEALQTLPRADSPFAQMTRGLALAGLGRWEEAAADFRAAVAQAPENADLRFQLARALLELAAYDEAREHLDQAVQLNPRHVPALNYRGYIELATGRFQEGIPWLERSLALEPEQPQVQAHLSAARGRGPRN